MKNQRIKTNNNSIIIRQQQEGYNKGETEIPKHRHNKQQP